MVTIQHYLGSARSNLFRIMLSYLDFLLLLLLSCCYCLVAQLYLTLCDPMAVGILKYILDSKFLSDIWFTKYFLSFCKLSSDSFNFFFSCTETFQTDAISSVYLCFCCSCFWFCVQEIIDETDVMKLFPLFSSRSFTGRGVTFKSLINFRLILCMIWELTSLPYMLITSFSNTLC